MIQKEKWDSAKSLQVFQLLRFGALVLVGILLTHSSVGTAEIGQYESFLFWVGLASFFWLNGLIQGALPMVGKITSASGDKEKSPFLFTLFTVLFVLSIFAVILFWLFYRAGFILFVHGQALQWFLLFLVFGVPANLIVYIYLIEERPYAMLVFGVAAFGLQILLILLVLLSGEGLITIFCVLALLAMLRFMWLLRLVYRHSSISFSRELAYTLLKRSWPLIVAALLSGSAQYIDGWLVTLRFDVSAFAIFRFGAREFPVVLLVANAFSNAMLIRFGEKESVLQSLNEIKKRSAGMMNWMFPLTAVLLLISHQIFPLIFNQAFAKSASIFNIYLLLIIPRLFFPQTVLNGIGRTRLISKAALYEMFINVVFSVLLSFPLGLEGIALATVVAYLFEKCYLAFRLYRLEGIPVAVYVDWKRYLLFSTGILTLFAVTEIVIY